ncbi:MAG: NCS2 family permease [Phycisphaerae bacterium]|nr:NCS2 family permease [Phycisphaerae bacterium]
MFEIKERGSTVSREIFGGITTFLAMSYIIFVQVAILGGTGMNHGGIIIATCLSAAVASIVMGLLANYPIALAPGMGENVFFAFILVPILATWGVAAEGWQMALALVAISGMVFLLLSFVGFRSYILNAIPESLKFGIAAGIGLMIAAIGLHFGNLIEFTAPAPVFAGFNHNPCAVLTVIGVAVIMILTAFRVPGAVLISIVVNAALAWWMGLLKLPGGIVGAPTGIVETAGGFISRPGKRRF